MKAERNPHCYYDTVQQQKKSEKNKRK